MAKTTSKLGEKMIFAGLPELLDYPQPPVNGKVLELYMLYLSRFEKLTDRERTAFCDYLDTLNRMGKE